MNDYIDYCDTCKKHENARRMLEMKKAHDALKGRHLNNDYSKKPKQHIIADVLYCIAVLAVLVLGICNHC